MRCVSLWQPWASGIALGLKQIETRHWSTPFRGPLAIHAAKRWTPDERDTAAMFADLYDRRLATPPLGAIMATCRLVDCRGTDSLLARGVSEQEQAFGNFGPGRFGWLLADVVALAEPISFRGAQGFFDVPDDILGREPSPPQQTRLL